MKRFSNYFVKDYDGYTVNDPREHGILFEDVHQGNVPLAPTDLQYDEAAEKEKANGDAGKLQAMHAAFS